MKNEMIDFNSMTSEQLDMFTKQATQALVSRMNTTLTEINEKVIKQDEKIEIFGTALDLAETKVKGLEDNNGVLTKAIKDTTIDRKQSATIKRLKEKRIFQLTGVKGSFKYILFYEKYSSCCGGDLKKKFGDDKIPLASYQDISKLDYESALSFVQKWNPSKKQHHDIVAWWITKRDYSDMTNEQLDAWEVYLSLEVNY